jgi:predicted amidohydrolase
MPARNVLVLICNEKYETALKKVWGRAREAWSFAKFIFFPENFITPFDFGVNITGFGA